MKELLEKISPKKRQVIKKFVRGYFWFVCGVVLGFFFFTSFVYITYKQMYKDVVYPGVYVNGIDFGGKSQQQVADYFVAKNGKVAATTFHFTVADTVATASAKELDYGYDENLLADQTYSVGRASNILSNISLMVQAYLSGVYLPPAYRYDEETLKKLLVPLQKQMYIAPVDAKFTFADERVHEFKQSSDGRDIDIPALENRFLEKRLSIITAEKPLSLTIPIPVKVLKPRITTEQVNNMGIKELVAAGSSIYTGSIPNRVYNVALAASRLDGILIKPGETFSFDKAIGDISTFTGYKQAYVIQNGRTVLGDGGGVCQVSTTLFRAVLNAGLPVVERNPHAYRVHYYEQDMGPGYDAAVYVPTVDFKFKNDTGHYLLIKTIVNTDAESLTFELYGTKDNREVTLSKPVITSVLPAPEPLYVDDPTLAKGQEKQVDFAASGATVYFTRVVKKDGRVIFNDKFPSYYRPWQAVFMRGTKEG
jgi:vancomycin resistance protein YoaR